MGLNDPDTRAAYALDALPESEALSLDASLATDADAAAEVAMLREVAGEIGAALSAPVAPPAPLRERTLAAALAVRSADAIVVASPREVHHIEAERFALLLRGLSLEQWNLPLDPPEFAGWTVHDLAVHVTANETLFAHLVADHDSPDTATDNEGRTAQAQERHRWVGTDAVIDEFAAAMTAVDDALGATSVGAFDGELTWWGADMRMSTVCIHRAFEIWTHADDIRRSLGLPQTSPPAPSLLAMSTRAAEWSGLMLASRGHTVAPTRAVLDLTGDGGRVHVVELGLEPAPAIAAPAFTLHLDVVDYCRAVGNRSAQTDLVFDAEGDLALARDLFDALPALAAL